MAEPVSIGSLTWGAIQAIVAIGVPLIGAVITVVLWLHRRLNLLEDADQQRKGAGQFFGDGDSPLSIGLAQEVREMKKWQNETKEDVENLDKDIEKIESRMDEIYEEVEKLVEEQDED